LGTANNEFVGGNYAYPIIIQAYWNGVPQDNVMITFQVTAGNPSGIDLGISGSRYTGTIFMDSEPFDGAVLLDSITSWNQDTATYTIRASANMKGTYYVDFDVTFMNDDEPSGFSGTETHEHDRLSDWYEIPGDLRDDGIGQKDLYIELDCDSYWKQGNQIHWIVEQMRNILATAGVAPHILADTVDNMPRDDITYESAKSLLSSYRDSLEYLHVLLPWASPSKYWKYAKDALGIAVDYGPLLRPDLNKYCCLRMATSHANRRAYLDSVGCIVFSHAVDTMLQHIPGWQVNWNSYADVLAYLLCHEIGHALGRTHHDSQWGETKGVMVGPDFWNSADSIQHHLYFLRDYLQTSSGKRFPETKDAVNTRDVLGITTIDVSS
jgi:hypothetical protein